MRKPNQGRPDKAHAPDKRAHHNRSHTAGGAAATQQSAHEHEGPHVFPDVDLNIPDEVKI